MIKYQIFSICIFCFTSLISKAQVVDRIYKNDNSILQVFVVSSKGDSVVYKQDKSIFKIAKTDINKIVYDSGKTKFFPELLYEQSNEAFILVRDKHKTTFDKIFLLDGSTLDVRLVNSNLKQILYKYDKQTPDSIYSIAVSQIDKIILRTGATRYYSDRAIDSLIKLPAFPIFLDASVGMGARISAFIDVSAGYRFNQQMAFGASYVSWVGPSGCCSLEANGIGAQLRLTPTVNTLFKIEAGYVKSAFYGDDGPYYSVYNHQKSNKIYFRVSTGFHFNIFSIGLTMIRTSGQTNDNYNSSTGRYMSSSIFDVRTTSLHLGVAIPKTKIISREKRNQ